MTIPDGTDDLGIVADSAGARKARPPSPLVGSQGDECAGKRGMGETVRGGVDSPVSRIS